MASKITPEVQQLFKKFRVNLGAPLMEVELTDEQMCLLLEMSVEDYASFVQNWVIEQQWMNLYGKNLNNTDIAFALSVRTFDMSKDFSYWFSKEAGLQQRGPWELKKDYFEIEAGKQSYVIPAGREINSVMYCNPPTTPAALYANYGGMDSLGFAGGYGQMGGTSYGPLGGFYIAQSADIAYMAADINFKTRMLRGDLTYKVTAGPEGTHIVHLFSTPGSRITFGGATNITGALNLVGHQVWYTYYDVANAADADECRRMNPDIILTPDQIPLEEMDYAFLNAPAKKTVRDLFFAKCKETLANIRGKFSGKILIPEAEANLDYNILITQATSEREKAIEELTKRLERMSPSELLKRQAEMVDSMLKIQGSKPMTMIIV